LAEFAIRAVMAQLEGSGRGSLASYNSEGYTALLESLPDLSKMGCEEWLTQLSQRNNLIG